MSNGEDLKAELDRLRSENEALKKTSARSVSLKVSEKGGVSVYGLGRFPVTLYKEQWNKLLDMAEEIRAFADNMRTSDARDTLRRVAEQYDQLAGTAEQRLKS